MTLKVLYDKHDIIMAGENLFHTLTLPSKLLGKNKVVYDYFDGSISHFFFEYENIYYSEEKDFWFSDVQNNKIRLIYSFGTGKPDMKKTLTPVCIIDFFRAGTDLNSLGVFAEDDKGNIYILIRLNSPELISSNKDIIKAIDRDKQRYFKNLGHLNQVNFIDNIRSFVEELEKMKNSNLSESATDEKLCSLCGNTLNHELSTNSALTNLINENPDKCQDCIEKMFAAQGIIEIKRHVINFFNEKSLLKKVDDPVLYESYLRAMKNQQILKELSEGVFMFQNAKELDEFVDKYAVSSAVPDSQKSVEEDNDDTINCKICGVEIPDSPGDKCKDCSRKAYAVKALENIKKYVDPETPFNKEDLLKGVDNRMQFLDYIWTLQELNLLDHDATNDSYILKDEFQLKIFIQKYGESTPSEVSETPEVSEEKTEPPIKKVVKECELCGNKLPLSHFYKSSNDGDGYSDKCKECSRKAYAARALVELTKCVDPGVVFYKKDLLDQCENKIQFMDYLWTMQELDLLEHNPSNDSYILKERNVLNEFIGKYGDSEIRSENAASCEASAGAKKAVKECLKCSQNLPISQFYKSSRSEDGYTDTCKKCSEKDNISRALSEILDFVEIGKSFTRDELLKQVNDPTKVNYYIWTLQEENLIEFHAKTDSYIIEDTDNLNKYRESSPADSEPEIIDGSEEDKINRDLPEKVDTPEQIETPVEEKIDMDIPEEGSVKNPVIKKEIVFISENNGHTGVLMKGIVENEKIISTINVLKCISPSINKLLVHRYDENHSDITIELEIENKNREKVLNMLGEKNWENMYDTK